jgi:hypothetical protein
VFQRRESVAGLAIKYNYKLNLSSFNLVITNEDIGVFKDGEVLPYRQHDR